MALFGFVGHYSATLLRRISLRKYDEEAQKRKDTF